MQTANQNMAVGCIMIVFALTVGISSVLLHEHRRENAEIEMGIQQDMAQILYTRQFLRRKLPSLLAISCLCRRR